MNKTDNKPPRVLAYLRASTNEQDAERARDELIQFANKYGATLADSDIYSENVSGTQLDRPELSNLIKAATPGTVLLLEQIDRLTRLPAPVWDTLKGRLLERGIKVVSLDLPTSHRFMQGEQANIDQGFDVSLQNAINSMLLDILAAIARKDYEDRRRRQKQGQDKARQEGRVLGRRANYEVYEQLNELLDAGISMRNAAKHHGVTLRTVQRAKQWRQEGSKRR